MKLKDLLFNREKLRKHDELKKWRETFDGAVCLSKKTQRFARYGRAMAECF